MLADRKMRNTADVKYSYRGSRIYNTGTRYKAAFTCQEEFIWRVRLCELTEILQMFTEAKTVIIL